MKLVWMVSVKQSSFGRTKCLFDSLKEAWEDFKTHDWNTFKLIYPKLAKEIYLENLKEFEGW